MAGISGGPLSRLLLGISTCVLVAVVTVGCGGDESSPETEPSAPASTPASTAPATSPAEARKIARTNCRSYEKVARTTRQMHERWFSGLPIRYAEFTFDYGTGHRAIERMEKAPGHRELNRALDEAGRAYLRVKAAVFGARPSEVVTRRIKGWDAVDAKVHRLCVELSAQGTGTKA